MLTNEEIVAMAIGAIAEELKINIKRVRILSFEEESDCALNKYLQEKGITFSKYQLGD